MTDAAKDNRKQVGARGEREARVYLERLGYTIADANWRCRSGEIDLVAEFGDIVVFIEVRTRRSAATFGTPQESVDARKQRQVVATAQMYMQQKRIYNKQVRFDVIAVMLDAAGGHVQVEHIPNAF